MNYKGLIGLSFHNESVRYLRESQRIRREMENGNNPADLAVAAIENGSLRPDQVPALFSTLLVEKFGYESGSINLSRAVRLDAGLAENLSVYPTLDMAALYFHSSGLPIPFNPKNKSHLAFLELEAHELVVIYAVTPERDMILASKGIAVLSSMLEGGDLPEDENLLDLMEEDLASGEGRQAFRVEIRVERFTAVEADLWEKILAGFHETFPGLQVTPFFGGRPVENLGLLAERAQIEQGRTFFFRVRSEGKVAGSEMLRLRQILLESVSTNRQSVERFLKKNDNRVEHLFGLP